MPARILISSLVGGFVGAALGACGFALAEKAFGRGMLFFGNWPLLAALIGIVLVGVPGVAVGALVGGFGLGRGRGALAGLLAGLLLVSFLILRVESKYFYEGGYFDERKFFSDVIMYLTCLAGLSAAGWVVSRSAGRWFPTGR